MFIEIVEAHFWQDQNHRDWAGAGASDQTTNWRENEADRGKISTFKDKVRITEIAKDLKENKCVHSWRNTQVIFARNVQLIPAMTHHSCNTTNLLCTLLPNAWGVINKLKEKVSNPLEANHWILHMDGSEHNSEIDRRDTSKFEGVLVDEKLSWKDHFEYVC